MGSRQVVVGFALSAMAVAYLDRVCIAAAAPWMRAELGLSDSQLGYVFSAFTLAYALFEMPSGYLADRYGARLMMARIVVWWSLLTAATGAATGFVTLLLIRFLFGVGEAGLMPTLARAFAVWLPWYEAGRAFGATIMAGAVAGAVTQPLAAALFDWIGWRAGFVCFGAVGLVWVWFWLRWFVDSPEQHASISASELAEILAHRSYGTAQVHWSRSLLRTDYLTLCVIYFLVIYGWYFYITWLPSYLIRGRGLEPMEAGFVSALPLIAIAAGVASGGWLSDRLAQRYGAAFGRGVLAAAGLVVAALCLAVSVTTDHALWGGVFLAAAAGLAAVSVAPAWALCGEIGGKDAGVLTGGMNMLGNLGGALNGVTVGWIYQGTGSWELGLWSIAAAYGLAAVLWLRVASVTKSEK